MAYRGKQAKVKLSKRERLNLFYQQSQLEQNHCKECPKSGTTLDPDTVCAGCPIYLELRNIGRRLIGKDDKAEWRKAMEEC